MRRVISASVFFDIIFRDEGTEMRFEMSSRQSEGRARKATEKRSSREFDSVKRGNLRIREDGAVTLVSRMVFGQ